MKTSAAPPFRRIIEIDRHIRSGKYPNATTLAKALEAVTSRTIRRDIEYMKYQLNAPIEFDASRNGYYYTDPNYFIPSINLQEKDLFAFVVAEKILTSYKDAPYYADLKKVIDQIAAFLPESVVLADARATLSVHASPLAEAGGEVFPVLQEAVAKHRTVELTYHAHASNEETTRLVDVYHLLNHQGGWYAIGYCHTREAIRAFATNRILAIRLTGDGFTVSKEFNLQDYFDEGFKRGERSYHIELKFSPKLAAFVQERRWHKSEIKKELPDGSLLLQFTVPHLYDVKRLVLGYGADVEVIKPNVLRQILHEESKRVVKLYKDA